MLGYEPSITEQVLDALAQALKKGREEVLEDIGTYLVTSRNSDSLRRLLRFGGTDFVDFLYSLDDLPARARLAMPELVIPQLELREHTAQSLSLHVFSDRESGRIFSHAIIGLLRAMADDYGALVMLEHKGGNNEEEVIGITLLEAAFARARSFELGAGSG